MKSFQASVYEVDDVKTAVSELMEQIDTSKFLKNTCGIICCGFEIDTATLSSELNREFGFPFVGITGAGHLDNSGYQENSISLTVLTDDDCRFVLGITDEINGPQDFGYIRETYYKCHKGIDEKEKLIFTFAPWWMNVMYDDVVKILDEVSGGVSIYGGVASDHWNFSEANVFDNNGMYTNREIILLMFGDIRPIFAIEMSSTPSSSQNHLITKSKDSVVYEIDEKPVMDVIGEMGLITDKTSVILDYLGTPFLSTKRVSDEDEIEVLRCLAVINHEIGSCMFIGEMEEGSKVNLAYISKEDIENSVRAAFDVILERINATKDYHYSTIFCTPCAARYCLIVADKNVEGRAYEGRIPEGINVQGVYTFGGFCPAKGNNTGKLYNVLSNESFTIMAI